MNFSKIFVISLLIASFVSINAQENKVWNKKKCAVVLTYDDALNVHLDNVIPVLDSLGLKATFFVPCNSASLDKRMNEWRAAAKEGHELGNHTLFHPCHGKSMNRDWVKPDYDMDNYTVGKMVDEIRLANTMLKAVDGKTDRTFAYTCGDNSVDDSVFTDLISNDFAGARSVNFKLEKIDSVDLLNIGCFMANGQTGEELINIVKQAEEQNALLVFLFHGVGGEHDINVALNEHNKLVKYLKKNEKDIWVAPLVDVAEYVKKYRLGKN